MMSPYASVTVGGRLLVISRASELIFSSCLFARPPTCQASKAEMCLHGRVGT